MLIPEPRSSETATDYADRVGVWFTSIQSDTYRKQHGQYFTPVGIAKFMARQVESRTGVLNLLDPGAGAGVLACAVCEALASQADAPREIILEAYETDPDLFPVLKRVLQHLQDRLQSRGIPSTMTVSNEDFVLKYGAILGDATADVARFDLVIANPPYFKLAKSDPRSKVAGAVVHGQPNIYALFMAIGASLLAPKGELVFITPRSFASGLYFRQFRRHFFSIMKPEAIHVFDSRRESFRRDGVLQENIIIKARRFDNWLADNVSGSVLITSSQGVENLERPDRNEVPLDVILDLSSSNSMLHIPASAKSEEAIDLVASWAGSLKKYGMAVSTGPVVPFRAESALSMKGDNGPAYAPLLWMQSVNFLEIHWPAPLRTKPQFIRREDATSWLLLPDKNYLLIRRVSAKEDRRRLTAAPLIAGSLGSPYIGLENHLNYIHRPGGSLSEDEVWGLAALYNSSLFDSYFRTLNGNTQVSATELRAIPLPDLDVIKYLGARVRELRNPERELDTLVDTVLTRGLSSTSTLES